MLDNQPTDAPSSGNVKRYAPPNQRNKLNRRKSGDRLDRANSLYGNDGEKNLSAPSNENARPRLIPLNGLAVYNAKTSEYDGSIRSTVSEITRPAIARGTKIAAGAKPVLFSSAGPAWVQFKLPHQMVSGPPTVDFLTELKRSMQNSGLDIN